MAGQGLFAYDWDHALGQYESNRPYRRIATPEAPLTLDDVPPFIRAWLETVRFEDVDFAEAVELYVEASFREVNL